MSKKKSPAKKDTKPRKYSSFKLFWQGRTTGGQPVMAYTKTIDHISGQNDITLRILTHDAYPAPLYGAVVARCEDYDGLSDMVEAQRQMGRFIDQRKLVSDPRWQAEQQAWAEDERHPF